MLCDTHNDILYELSRPDSTLFPGLLGDWCNDEKQKPMAILLCQLIRAKVKAARRRGTNHSTHWKCVRS